MLRIQLIGLLVMLTSVVFGQVNFNWVKQFGGPGVETITNIVTDSFNNVYMAGIFTGNIDIDPNIGVQQLVPTGQCDVYIVKLDSAGNLIWFKQFKSSAFVNTSNLEIDRNNNIYITGSFIDSVDFDPSINNFILQTSLQSSFICKLDLNGEFIWVKDIPILQIPSITIDVNSNIYLFGSFRDSVDIDPNASIHMLYSNGKRDALILKMNSSGDFVWAHSYGNNEEDDALKGIVDKYGNIYFSGSFSDTVDFDQGVNVFNLYEGEGKMFIIAIDSIGSFKWAKSYGVNLAPDSYITPSWMTSDSDCNIYLQGYFKGSVDINPNLDTNTISSMGDKDVYICKLDSLGNLIWVHSMGGQLEENAGSHSLDNFGNIYISNRFRDTIQIQLLGGEIKTLQTSGQSNIALLKLDNNGNPLWAKQIGDIGTSGAGVIKSKQSLYVFGVFTQMCDFDVNSEVFILSAVGNNDAFLLKMTSWPTNIPPLPTTDGVSLYPNPSNQSSILQFTSQQQFPYQVSIYSITGSLVKNSNGVAIIGENKITLDIENLPPSMYFVRLKLHEEFMQTLKLTTY